MPALGAWLSSSGGTSSPSMSRPLSVNQSSLVSRVPVEARRVLRTPRANTSRPLPSGFMRRIAANGSSISQMLQGAPTGT